MLYLQGGEDVHNYCILECDKSKVRMVDGERFICCEDGIPVVCMDKCPLNKWVAKDTYLIVPREEI